MRSLTAQGYGQDVVKADVITDHDEELLWSTSTIGFNSSQGLLYGVYFYNVRAFGLRGGKIHRALDKEQFRIILEAGVEKLRYCERLSKCNQGGLKHLKVRPINPEIIAQPENPRCIVKLFKAYLAHIPDNGPFYLHPSRSKKNDDWYSSMPVGHNTLSGFLPEMFKAAKIDTTGRHITGHSGRATMCSKLFNEGFQESTVKERSGHRSKAVQSYMRANENMKRGINNVLQAKLPSLLYTDAMPPLRRTQGN